MSNATGAANVTYGPESLQQRAVPGQSPAPCDYLRRSRKILVCLTDLPISVTDFVIPLLHGSTAGQLLESRRQHDRTCTTAPTRRSSTAHIRKVPGRPRHSGVTTQQIPHSSEGRFRYKASEHTSELRAMQSTGRTVP